LEVVDKVGCGLLRVYRIPFSTNVERVALAAGHKRLPVEWVDVDPGDRTPVERVSGQGLVPVLVADDREVVADSTAILEWIEEHHPEPPLYPAEPSRRAEARVFAEWFNQIWKRPPNLITAELMKPTPDEGRIAELGDRMRSALDVFEELLAGRDYLLGHFGVADCLAFPFLKYAALGTASGDDELFHHVLVDHQPLGDAHPRLRAWVERVDAHPRS